jgi:lambda family phage portal protein
MRWPFSKRTASVPADTNTTGALSEVDTKKRRTWWGRSMAAMFKAGMVNDNDRWNATPVSADAFMVHQQPKLVARSREQWSNNDYVRAFVRLVKQNVIGPTGVGLQSKVQRPRGGLDKEACAAIESAWQEWGVAGMCEVTGTMSWRDVSNLMIETTARDGEMLARKIYGTDAGPWGFSLQLIDPQRLPTWYETAPKRGDGSFIRQGIEFNRFGRPLAYHFTSADEWDASYYTFAGRGFVRVPADQIIHRFVHEMVGQKRGLPWASTSLFRLHHLQGFEDAAVQNARAGATKMGFIEYEEGFGPEMDEDESLSIDAEPLSFQELPEGARFKEFTPQYPNGEFATFHKAMLRGAAAGMGVLYNNMAGDLEGVNFSSIRQGTLDEREHYKDLQQWFIENIAQHVFDEWLKFSLLAGKITTASGRALPADKLQAYRKIQWQPRRWQWIDPRADVASAIDSIRAGLTSISQVIRDQGRDPETVFQELAEDLKAMAAAGIPEDIIMLFILGAPPKPEPTKKDPQGGTEE